MVNPIIAPPADLDVDGRIREIEKFLEEEEKKLSVPKSSPQMVIKPTQQAQNVSLAGNEEIVTLLKKISENQEIDRKRFERSNPVTEDDPIYDWSEATINQGQVVQFTYTVPEGHVFYLEYVNIVHNIDTTYSIFIDGQYQPNLSYAIEDFGDHMSIWKPPKMCYNNVQVWALNNWVAPQTYATFFRGFNRFYRAIKRELTYESLKKEKQET